MDNFTKYIPSRFTRPATNSRAAPDSNSWSKYFTKPSFLAPKNVVPSQEQELVEISKSKDDNSSMNQKILNPPVFKILSACSEAKTLQQFINYIKVSASESHDRDAALTKLNDIFHCKNADNHLKKLKDEQKNFIIQSLNKRNQIKILIEALETKIKEFPQGSTRSGWQNIIKQCKLHLYDTMIDLARGDEDQLKGSTQGMCVERSCSAADLEKLKDVFMTKTMDKPSACSHYIIKDSVSRMLDIIKTKWNFNESPKMPYIKLMDQVMSIAGIDMANLQDLIIDSNDINSKIRIFIEDCEKALAEMDLKKSRKF